jgi:beta-mannosidase
MALIEHVLDEHAWTLRGYYPGQWQAASSRRGGCAVGPLPATVPGAVQADLLAAGLIPNPYREEQSRLSEWVAAREWEYATTFTPPMPLQGKSLFLALDGLDPGGTIIVNGEVLVEHPGGPLSLETDVTALLTFDRENELRIRLHEAPPQPNQFGALDRALVTRPRFTYQWDFATRYPPIGLGRPVRLLALGRFRLVNVWVRPQVHLHDGEAVVSTTIAFHALKEGGCEVRTSLKCGEALLSTEHALVSAGKAVQEVRHEHFIAQPRLWWPNGYGEQPLYEMVTELFDARGDLCDQQRVTFGIRDLRFVRNDGAAPTAFPYTVLVNDTPIFLKGGYLLPRDHLYAMPNEGKVVRLLRMARDAGVNCLHAFAGGPWEDETVYRQCDALGLLIWQDFPLCGSQGGSTPAGDTQTLAQWEILGPALLASRRNHPALAIWCGGHELTDGQGHPATCQHPTLALLQRLVREHDPDRLFLPTSPSGAVFMVDPRAVYKTSAEQGDVHGPWGYLGPERHYQYHDGLNAMLYGAYGCGGATHPSTMRQLADEERLWPPTTDNPLWAHRGGLCWSDLPRLEMLFGELPDLDSYAQASQFLQAEAVRYAIEASRRRKWRSSGMILWHLNEPWPNLICPALIDYFGHAKPAYYAAANAFRPEAICARFEKIAWQPGDMFLAELYLINSRETARALEWSWTLYDLAGNALAGWCAETLSHPNAASRVGTVRWMIPKDFTHPFLLRATVSNHGRTIHHNDYLFSCAPPPMFAPLSAHAPASLAVQAHPKGSHLTVRIENTGTAAAFGVTVSRPDGHWLYGIDNYRHLLPGEVWTAQYTIAAREGFDMGLWHTAEEPEIAVSAWYMLPVLARWGALV